MSLRARPLMVGLLRFTTDDKDQPNLPTPFIFLFFVSVSLWLFQLYIVQ